MKEVILYRIKKLLPFLGWFVLIYVIYYVVALNSDLLLRVESSLQNSRLIFNFHQRRDIILIIGLLGISYYYVKMPEVHIWVMIFCLGFALLSFFDVGILPVSVVIICSIVGFFLVTRSHTEKLIGYVLLGISGIFLLYSLVPVYTLKPNLDGFFLNSKSYFYLKQGTGVGGDIQTFSDGQKVSIPRDQLVSRNVDLLTGLEISVPESVSSDAYFLHIRDGTIVSVVGGSSIVWLSGEIAMKDYFSSCPRFELQQGKVAILSARNPKWCKGMNVKVLEENVGIVRGEVVLNGKQIEVNSSTGRFLNNDFVNSGNYKIQKKKADLLLSAEIVDDDALIAEMNEYKSAFDAYVVSDFGRMLANTQILEKFSLIKMLFNASSSIEPLKNFYMYRMLRTEMTGSEFGDPLVGFINWIASNYPARSVVNGKDRDVVEFFDF